MGIFDKALGYEFGLNSAKKQVNEANYRSKEYERLSGDLVNESQKLYDISRKQENKIRSLTTENKQLQYKLKQVTIEATRRQHMNDSKLTDAKDELNTLKEQLDAMAETVEIYKDLYEKERIKNQEK